jgi:hypothetical protein
MITAQDVLEALEKNLVEIRRELGPDWSHFYQELAPLQAGFIDITDRNALEVTADPVWQVCRRYPFVKDLIHKHTQQRRPPAGGKGHADEIPIRETVNRFQSLFDSLKKIEPSAKDTKRRSKDTDQSRAGDHDVRK